MKRWMNSVVFQIIAAVVLGLLFGSFYPGDLSGLSQVAKMILQWVRIIAGPFLFLSVIAALVQIRTSWKVGGRLLAAAAINTTCAIVIGMSLTYWLVLQSPLDLPTLSGTAPDAAAGKLSWGGWIQTLSPQSLFEPLVSNEIFLIALTSLLLGIAIRQAFAEEPAVLKKVQSGVESVRKVLEQVLLWILKIIPLAVFLVIAGSVSQYGLSIFGHLFRYVAVVVLALALQCVLVYGTWIFAIAKMSWKTFWGEAKKPVLYSLGMNSSLATLPLTMKALKNLKVSDQAASLGAGVATNLNNDGIVLYEASAVFFIAHLHGIHWDFWQMLAAAGACLIAAMGITGVPEAGFISLSVVVTSLGLPVETLPLLLSVDWVMARLRSMVNVLSDMTLAITIDHFEK